jgi:hypothetical protein
VKFLERFFQKGSEDLSKDPRWRRFNDNSYNCPCCERSFSGIFDIGFDHPDPWPHGHRGASGQDELIVGEDRLGTDLCRFDGHLFVRSVLYLPVRGSGERFGFGCWGSLSDENFDTYVEDTLGEAVFEGAFSWLANSLPCFESTDPLPCNMTPGAEGQRPSLWVQEGHPLFEAQQDGISFDTLLDIYEKTGSDLRPHLSDA